MANVAKKFNAGDRVVNRYGQRGTVQEYQGDFVQVLVDGQSQSSGWYESNLDLEIPAPVNPETKLGFAVGQRVEILNPHYEGGPFGVVAGFVDLNNSNKKEPVFVMVQVPNGRTGGWYPSNLKLVAPVAPVNNSIKDVWDAPAALTPNQQATKPLVCGTAQSLERATQAKYAGQNAAISKNSQVYQIAKNLAIQLGKDKKLVNVDMVQGELVNLGYKAADLGNAAGAIFRGKNWKDTGNTYLSRRESNHARRITVWAYVGN